MNHPENCANCPEQDTCHAAYYGATQCRYEREIHRAAVAQMNEGGNE